MAKTEQSKSCKTSVCEQVETQTHTAISVRWWTAFINLNMHIPHDIAAYFPGIYGMYKNVHNNPVIMARKWEKPTCTSSTLEWMKSMVYSYSGKLAQHVEKIHHCSTWQRDQLHRHSEAGFKRTHFKWLHLQEAYKQRSTVKEVGKLITSVEEGGVESGWGVASLSVFI